MNLIDTNGLFNTQFLIDLRKMLFESAANDITSTWFERKRKKTFEMLITKYVRNEWLSERCGHFSSPVIPPNRMEPNRKLWRMKDIDLLLIWIDA